MTGDALDSELIGWWRILDTSRRGTKTRDRLGPAVLSITGYADRLRMHFLLATVSIKLLKTGATITWDGASEFGKLHGTGPVRLRKSGTLDDQIRIAGGETSSLVAQRSHAPDESFLLASSYGDKRSR